MDFVKWTSREFDFNFPSENFLSIIKQLQSTAEKIKTITQGLSKNILTQKIDNAWSIQEHIGHLIDLDELHDGRINDFINKLEILRAADMTNQKTYKANHNERILSDLIHEFKNNRDHFISRLKKLDPNQSAFHPRLQKQMRVVDMAFFVAEHDNHHLMIIKNILNSVNNHN
ncbi:MAG: DinB family protein [Bacteroidota bacterium]